VLAGVWNRTPKPAFPCWKSTPEEVADAADVVQIVVAAPPAVREILGRILPALSPAKVVVQSSTIDPASSEEFRRGVTARGARYLEAPFTGSKPAAEQRQTVFYLGGDPELAAELEPLLSLISATRMFVGTNAQAAALKLAMNLNIAVQMEGLIEALTLARRAGVSDGKFFEALANNASYSGLAKLKERKLRVGDFAPQFSVKHMHKDMRLASGMPAGRGLPALEVLCARLAAAETAGFAEQDFSALAKLLSQG
jgi:3-hydroxyisobutyrate dehydrogenase-like beta-hydroxyacid dehydrogenase